MKQFVKKIVSVITYYLRLWHLLYYLYPKSHKKHILAVLTFHRVIPREKAKEFVADYDIGLDVVLYEILLEELSKYYNFIDLNDFIGYVSGKAHLQKHSMMITFDDADADFPNYALSILEKNKWPAVIFAPTSFLDSDKRFWHLRISNMMYHMDDESWQKIYSIKSELPGNIREIFTKYPAYDKSLYYPLCRELIHNFDSINDDEILTYLERIESLIDKPYNIDIKCLNWEQLTYLEKLGISIESHTVSHRKLKYLSDDNILAELSDSKSTIESMLKKNVNALCYPAGSYNDRVAELVEQSGYKVSFTTENRIIDYPLKGIELYKIPRISLGGKNKYEINFEIGRLINRR